MPAVRPQLPGVYFLPPARPTGIGLPPLDVAGFVGFAERGPLHLPVPVDDLKTYQDVFGGDLALAQAREAGGQTIFANLPRAVAGFFANGGRRCYVVRVAGEHAAAAAFAVPGLIALDVDGTPRRPLVMASSPGGWGESLLLGARFNRVQLPAGAFQVNDQTVAWTTGGAPQAIQSGDLLRLTFALSAGSTMEWLFPVTSAQPSGVPGQVTLGTPRIWQVMTTLSPSSPLAVQHVYRLPLEADVEVSAGTTALSTINGMITLTLEAGGEQPVARGDVLLLTASDGAGYLFPVATIGRGPDAGSPPAPRVTVGASELLRIPPPAENPPWNVLAGAPLSAVERLRFDLVLQRGSSQYPPLSDLAFNAGHARFWGDVIFLESSSLHDQASAGAASPAVPRLPGTPAAATDAARAADLFRRIEQDSTSALAQDGSLDPVVLAGLLAPVDPDLPLTYLPLGMPFEAADLVGPDPSRPGTDDLDIFGQGAIASPGGPFGESARLFLDPYLVPYPENQPRSAGGLLANALDRAYIQDRRLHGMHSLLPIDEVALISVPDAVHRNWQPSPAASVPSMPGPAPTPSPPPCPPEGPFAACGPGSSPTAVPAASGPAEGSAPDLPTAASPETFDLASSPLLAIQEGLITLCEARADAVGILSLPGHFARQDCINWQEELRRRLGLPPRGTVFDDVREIADLSYVAVYHPWILTANTGASTQLSFIPPDGPICGMIAARERGRQVWVAPANTPLQGALGLFPTLAKDDWAKLFALQFNLIREEFGTFRAMSAYTLADERDLSQLSVRRLLIVLRKAAFERGMDFVFETNQVTFRNGARVALEALLQFMFERGAFAGSTPQSSFRVVTDASVNPPESVDLGRFIALIQVAPSQPMEFITVLLTRTGDGQLQVTGA